MKQVVQTRDTVMILNEMVHDARIIRIGGTHPPAHIKKWMGDSIGRWEGDTLVVETTNFTDKTQFRGSGENLKVIERFTRTDDKTLLYRFTVEDPTTWDRPWSGEYPWRAIRRAALRVRLPRGQLRAREACSRARDSSRPRRAEAVADPSTDAAE